MSKEINEDEFGKYLSTTCTINRKILRLLFDLELEKNVKLQKEVEDLKTNPDMKNNLFFFENIIDFRTLTKLLEKYIANKDLNLLIDMNDLFKSEEESKILKTFLKNSVILRNDIWHHCITYEQPDKYFRIINNIKTAYELFKNKLIKHSEIFENSIKYLDICLEFFEKKNKKIK